MLLHLLNAVRYVSIPEAALYALIGFVVVFIGIAFLVFVVWAVGKILNSFDRKTDNKEAKALAEEKLTKATILEPENADEIPEETVAVIMAALMAYYQTNQPKCEFTVKRIKRI